MSNFVSYVVALSAVVFSCTFVACKKKSDTGDRSSAPPPLTTKMAPGPAAPPSLSSTHGVALGDVSSDSAIVWARTDRPARMHVRLESPGLRAVVREQAVRAERDHTGRVTVTGLEPGTVYHYAVWFTEDVSGEPQASPVEPEGDPGVARGSFKTAPGDDQPAAVRFAWGGDLAGQNVCRDQQRGFAIFEHINALKLDFFIALGDMIYADNPCEARGRYGNPQIAGAPLAATKVEQFWTNWKYARDDRGYRALLASVPTFAVWDDHESINDAGPAHDTRTTPPYRGDVHLLPLGLRAFLDYNALPSEAGANRLYRRARYGKHVELFFLDTRQYRDANGQKDTAAAPKTMLGKTQRTWLERGLVESNATWKIVVSSVPMSIPTGARPPEAGRDGWANFDQETGFEHELLGILRELKSAGVSQTIWLTTDVHFAAGFTYRPFARSETGATGATGQTDRAFVVHEWVSGPLSAGLFPSREYDTTLNPEPTFFHGPDNPDVISDFQRALEWMNVGYIAIDEAGALEMSIVNGLGQTVHKTTLTP